MLPLNVIWGETAEFRHTAVVPVIEAVGKSLTVITAKPLWAWEHVVELPSCTLTRV